MRKKIRDKRMFAPFSCCYNCHVPQSICAKWVAAENGKWERVAQGKCQFEGIIMLLVISAITKGTEQMYNMIKWRVEFGLQFRLARMQRHQNRSSTWHHTQDFLYNSCCAHMGKLTPRESKDGKHDRLGCKHVQAMATKLYIKRKNFQLMFVALAQGWSVHATKPN